MVFDKWYLIKSISAVTNYNSSSCYVQNDKFFVGILNNSSKFNRLVYLEKTLIYVQMCMYLLSSLLFCQPKIAIVLNYMKQFVQNTGVKINL